MKKTVLIICLAFAFIQAMGQKAGYDSLINIALANRYKAKVVVSPNRDSLLQMLPLTKVPAQRIQIILDIINNGQETSKSGLDYYYKILAWAKKSNDHVCEAIILAELGYNTYINGDNSNGLQLIYDALKLAKAAGDNYALGSVYGILALYYLNSDIKLYKLYSLKALPYSQAAHDDASVCMDAANLGSVYYQQHKPDSARYYLLMALELGTRINDLQQLARIIAFISAQQKDDAVILKYQTARMAIAVAAKSAVNMSHAFDALAGYYLKHHNNDSALFYSRKAYYYAANISLAAKVRSSKLLSQSYDGNNADSALKYTKVYSALHDSATNVQKIQDAQALDFAEQQHQQEIVKQRQDDQNTMRFYILFIIAGFLLLMAFVFWRTNVRDKRTNLLLQTQKLQTEQTLHELKATQAQLIQSEKMASLGQLTAGIAHEIRNPLNFVNNFSEIGMEMLEQLKINIHDGNTADVIFIANDLAQSLEKIRHHGKRADGIVKSMMQSRASTAQKEPTDINQLVDQYFRLAYQDLRARHQSFNINPVKNFGAGLPLVKINQQDMGRVFLNLFNNAFYAVQQKQITAGAAYKPVVEIKTAATATGVAIVVKDNGTGIPKGIIEKVMQPFFTTKPPGQGTGLGLSLSYDIVVKGHKGEIDVTSNEGSGSEFTILLPFNV